MRVLFFFQAEDGIRDLVRSRGLGDVYKRQVPPTHPGRGRGVRGRRELRGVGGPQRHLLRAGVPVSYTHLTLPTSDLV